MLGLCHLLCHSLWLGTFQVDQTQVLYMAGTQLRGYLRVLDMTKSVRTVALCFLFAWRCCLLPQDPPGKKRMLVLSHYPQTPTARSQESKNFVTTLESSLMAIPERTSRSHSPVSWSGAPRSLCRALESLFLGLGEEMLTEVSARLMVCYSHISPTSTDFS